MQLNTWQIKSEFPIFRRQINGHNLVYLDSAATTQKPQVVIDAIVQYYSNYNSNIHRGLHTLSTESSNLWDKAHEVVADFINAKKAEEIIFVRNTTEGINLIAQTYGVQKCVKGDVIAISEMEHHSNILPWQYLAKSRGIKLEWIPVNSDATLDMNYVEYLVRKYREKLKIVALTHVSNVTGVRNDIKKIASTVHKYGAVLVVDGAQAITHTLIDVQKLDCDFYVFSGHKIYGPNGAGVVYGKYELIKDLEPFMRGGGIIVDVERNGATWEDSPTRFEAGTPDIADGIALAVALLWFHEKLTGSQILFFEKASVQNSSSSYGVGSNTGYGSDGVVVNNYSNVSQNSSGSYPQSYTSSTQSDYGSSYANTDSSSSNIDDLINSGGRYRYMARKAQMENGVTNPVPNAYESSSYGYGVNTQVQTQAMSTTPSRNDFLNGLLKYGTKGKKILRRDLTEGYKTLEAQEAELMKYAISRLSMIPDLQIFGPTDYRDRVAVLSFTMDGAHPHDIASYLDEHGIAIRAGMHCAHPLHRRFELSATARISFGIYSSTADVDSLVSALSSVKNLFK